MKSLVLVLRRHPFLIVWRFLPCKQESVTCDVVALLLLGNTVQPGGGARAVDVEVHDLSVLE